VNAKHETKWKCITSTIHNGTPRRLPMHQNFSKAFFIIHPNLITNTCGKNMRGHMRAHEREGEDINFGIIALL
jgi:hypothetical protein